MVKRKTLLWLYSLHWYQFKDMFFTSKIEIASPSLNLLVRINLCKRGLQFILLVSSIESSLSYFDSLQ